MALPTHFAKMAGGGNDFLVFEADGRLLDRRRTGAASRSICRRGLSVGADGALFLSPGETGPSALDYFNSDGGPATFCANGTRCAARYAVRHGLVARREPDARDGLGTDRGARRRRAGDAVAARASPPRGSRSDLGRRGLPPTAIPLEVGVPHLVVFVRGDLASSRSTGSAPPLRHHPAMPDGANVNFVQAAGDNRIEVRTYERGVEGETLSCGSGVVAAAIAAGAPGNGRPRPSSAATKSGVDLPSSFRGRRQTRSRTCA